MHPCPSGCAKEIYDQLLKCWDPDPDGRPDFARLKSFFLAMRATVAGNSGAPHRGHGPKNPWTNPSRSPPTTGSASQQQQYDLGHQDVRADASTVYDLGSGLVGGGTLLTSSAM